MTQNRMPTYPQDSKWSILEGEDQNKIMFVRRNESAKQLLGHSDYIYRLGVAVPLLAPTSTGLPTNEEANTLHSVEDSLKSEIEKNQNGLLVLVITTDEMREFVFYTKTRTNLEQSILLALSRYESYKFQYYLKEDASWEIYKELSESL